MTATRPASVAILSWLALRYDGVAAACEDVEPFRRPPCVRKHLRRCCHVVMRRVHHRGGFLGTQQLVERGPDPRRRRGFVDESHRDQRTRADAWREVDGIEVAGRRADVLALDVPVGIWRGAAVERAEKVTASR